MRTIWALLALTILAPGLSAQGWIEPDRPLGDFGVTRTRTSVSVRVSGRVARVEVEEWFQNHGGRLGEGDYLYPLPGEAVFADLSLFQGDVELKGETMDADQARRIYEEIVRRKKDPALIELAGHGLLRARVFPINPGETRKITLRYTQMLARAGDALQLRYAAGGRNGGPARGEGAQGPQRVREAVPLQFTVTVDSAARFRDPFSPTHDVEVTRRDGRIVVRPRALLTGDFSLFLPLADQAVGLTLATHRPDGENGYFMLTLSPAAVREGAAARDLTVVVDVSGSMSGTKLEQAKAALNQVLGTLAARDRFRLIAFSSGVRSQAPDWTGATPAAVAQAREWVDGLSATGGTNIEGALAEAFRLQPGEGRLPIVLFLTDGLPSVGEQNPEQIAARTDRERGATRVFAFGIGYDVNTYLLDRLSAAGRGATAYIEPHESMEDAVGGLMAKIQHPVLTDLALESGARLEEIYPQRLPDLFAGEEMVVFGRYSGSGKWGVVVSGRRGGRSERYTTDGVFPRHENGNDFIPRLWASRKIGVLQQSLRLNGPNAEVVEEIRQTALRYGLLSEYTSYLVQEPDVVANCATCLTVPGASGRGAAAPAPAAAAEQSGARFVDQARRDQERRELKSMAQLNAADTVVLMRAHFGQAQRVAGRVFQQQRDGTWADLLHGDSLPVVKIEPFSPAYFEVLRQLPELRPVVQQMDRVVVAGRRVSIQFEAGGRTAAAEVQDVVARFRAP
jgi:Ca-activated chloride channel family protein